jgi:hypothetical protein
MRLNQMLCVFKLHWRLRELFQWNKYINVKVTIFLVLNVAELTQYLLRQKTYKQFNIFVLTRINMKLNNTEINYS